jgi:hypothetical protein
MAEIAKRAQAIAFVPDGSLRPVTSNGAAHLQLPVGQPEDRLDADGRC